MLNININGVNTHLHHKEFNRKSKAGYKDNYVYCLCPVEKKNQLNDMLQALYPAVIDVELIDDSVDDGW